MQQPLAYIPSPSQNSVHLGPIPLRGYAFMIIIGVIVAVWLSERRWAARGGVAGTVIDIAVWAVPFGLVGGRLYHVITDHQLYFGHGRHPIDALKVWNGGLGIWGAIALGALGAYLGARRRGVSLRVFADAAAPGVALAQAIGRWGNWFNQELYGRPTKLPWAVEIDPAHRPAATPDIGTYHPTFLYESLWCVGVALLVIWAEKRFRLAYGRTFALYVAAYTVGRAWIEWLRVDPAHHVLGLRLNDWTSLIVFLAAAGYLYAYRARTENPPGAFGTAAEETEAAAAAAGGAVAAERDGEPESAEETEGAEETEKTSGGIGDGGVAATGDTAEAAGDDADAEDGETAGVTHETAAEPADEDTTSTEPTPDARAEPEPGGGAADPAGEETAAAGADAGAEDDKAAAAGQDPETASEAASEAGAPESRPTANGVHQAHDEASAAGGSGTERTVSAGKVGDDRTEKAAAGGEPADA